MGCSAWRRLRLQHAVSEKLETNNGRRKQGVARIPPGAHTYADLSCLAVAKRFTLVELLVVIGIIAILVGILLPSLASARRAAANVKCLSNLKNLHNALLMYAGDFKNSTPVGRQDDWDPITRIATSNNRRYWVDMLYPYVFRKPNPVASTWTPAEAAAYQSSVLWCPTWAAEHPEINVALRTDPDRFRNGYGFNIYLGFRPDYPSPDAILPAKLQAMWSGIWNMGTEGRYYKRNELKSQAERLILADANMWIIGLSVANGNPNLAGQIVDTLTGPAPPENGANGLLEQSSTASGAMNLDRYRHGKPTKVATGNRFATTGGRVAFNVLFVDGHAASLNSIQDGYKSIRQRFP